jgi:branched-chain amino acid transport system substrate-binding protein
MLPESPNGSNLGSRYRLILEPRAMTREEVAVIRESHPRHRLRRFSAAAAALAGCVLTGTAVQAAEPITIGFGMALTGGLAAAGKTALLAMQIWHDDVNAKEGLLGRPVKLVYYDDQTNPATVPGIYTKLLDVDKVDIIVSGYGTNMIAPAMPIAIQHDRLFLGLFGLAVNSEFHYPKYFSMLPTGPDPKHAFSDPFFKIALAKEPKPKTLAIVAADAEYPKNASEGARDTAKALGLQVVYDKSYPPSTADFSPIVRAIQATNPEIVFVASYPPDSAGMVRTATEIGLKTRYFGGGMVGLQFTSVKQQFGSKLNGILDYDWWIPAPKMQFPGIMDFLEKYQAKAPSEKIDPLGWYLPPFAYANLQVLGDAIEGAKSLDQTTLADYIRNHSFNTIVGDIAFGKDGEWSKPRVLEVQFQDIQGTDIEQFKDTKTEVILEPAEFRTGEVVEPYSSIKK